jgi:hypothetical protein
MKKLLIMVMAIGLVSGVSAQRHGGGGGFHGGGYIARPVIVPSYGYGYGYGLGLGLGYGIGYPFYGFPPYGYNYGNARPSKLTQKIEDIKSDYQDRIYSARNDANLNGKARRQEVRQLKHERDDAINNLKSNYYKSPKQQIN